MPAASDPRPVEPIRSESGHRGILAAVERAHFRGPIIVVARCGDSLVRAIESRGVTIGRLVNSDDAGILDWGGPYEGAVVADGLMQAADPRATLARVNRSLAPGAPLILSMPLLDGYQARLMGRSWHEWQIWNRWYFTRETLNLLLLAAGFEKIWFKPERRRYSLDDLSQRMRDATIEPLWWRALRIMRRISPQTIGSLKFPLPSGTDVVTAIAAAPKAEPTLSIVVPVFNERSTIKLMMDALLAKEMPGLRREIIVVESNSTDGSRDLVRGYEGHPDVTVILQSGPRGKGNAVREGLQAVTGDVVMIQDADLEYDLNDYDDLLAPLLAWQTMFVLGSRHQGGWKIRKFNDAHVTAAVFNAGHWFFKSLINFVLGTQMSDPFTMFKLFRRDALYGLDLKSDRFDLDIELVLKLVRKGYVPIELPVNYNARSFAEGKKVSISRDGVTWVWTILKYRFVSLKETVAR